MKSLQGTRRQDIMLAHDRADNLSLLLLCILHRVAGDFHPTRLNAHRWAKISRNASSLTNYISATHVNILTDSLVNNLQGGPKK